jgi:tetratricopeptide (TPR) repeat protein
MLRDAQGLKLTVASEAAGAAYDAAVAAFLGYRVDAPQRLKAALAVDPEAPLLLVLRGAFALLTYNAAALPSALASAARARGAAASGTAREQAHAAALTAWAAGEIDTALAGWEAILADAPRDVLAFRLHHFCAFWLGRPAAMARAAERVAPHFGPADAAFASMLACRCFALEEIGRLGEAEAAGREAIERDPGELWAAHGVAHVLEMQGRRGEGIAWLAGLEANWTGANNLKHHLFWHRALFHLERGESETVLRLYDHAFRDLAAPLTQALPDMFVDIQNAASMLFRLRRMGVDAGTRWEELADKAEARLGDTLSAFTLPHWMMALAATGRFAAAARLLDTISEAARGNGTNARILSRTALPVCRAVLHQARGEHAAALAAMTPALASLTELGGSHAQQDVLEQLYLDSALAAGDQAAARTLLERVAGRWPTPPERRIGYAAAARAIAH